MNCCQHHDRVAVGTCSECGQPLCSECYGFTNGHLCLDCAKAYYAHDVKLLKKIITFEIFFAIVFGAVMGGLLWQNMGAAAIGLGVYSFMGGFAFGYALVANRDQRKTWQMVLGMVLAAYILGPIMFIINLVRTIKLAKNNKFAKQTIIEYSKL